ncbi:hypothetical protein [Flavobacterium hungaricum]|nr:hypothetical protein [Flavobacterium hungaricum]
MSGDLNNKGTAGTLPHQYEPAPPDIVNKTKYSKKKNTKKRAENVNYKHF